MSLPDKTAVLIVGAGPTGLSTALSLLHHGFQDFIIVDALPQGRNISRSILCHASALEALDTIGCGDDIVSQGLKSTVFDTETRSMKLFSLHTENLKSYTRHPYFLTIPQNVTERIFERKLANVDVIIHRPLTVIGLERNPENPRLTDVTFEDGRVITTSYVIGADGARSSIRTLSGIGFSDPTFVQGEEQDIQAQMIIADIIFHNMDVVDLLPKVTVSPNGVFFLFPLPSSFNESLAISGEVPISERVYRILCGVPLTEGEIARSPSKEYIQSLVNRFGPFRLSSDPAVNPNSKGTPIKQVIFSSRFRNRAMAADTTFVRLSGTGNPGDGGAVLLVGDAAHIHSPAGAQGMNLSLRDGIFLGEVLTRHIRAAETMPLSKADMILHEFAATRHARALEVIKLTKRIAALEGLQYRERMAWWLPIDSGMFRVWALWVIGRIPFVVSKMVWDLSGLGKM